MRRVRVRWTQTAKQQLAALPLKVRRGLLEKADGLLKAGNPRKRYKPLIGPLEGHYRIPYSRYRAIYRVEEETLSDGSMGYLVTVTFIAVGIRRAGDKHDIYRLAERLVRLASRGEEDQAEAPNQDKP